ncbi:MAG TPA: HAMP domain-containing sensor histidine kinase [Trueperaceae bacterium]|nr:HAMP domain-containing sensor histidine kinase [Trueperaceae bacterium]
MEGSTRCGREFDLMLLSGVLLAGGLVADLLTPQALVIAILYNIPIALASLSRRRSAPVVMAGLAFGANVLSGYVNAIATPPDTIALLNRGLAAVSFVLVAFLSVALREASGRAARLRLEEQRFRREEALRSFLRVVSAPEPTPVLLESLPAALVALLGARNVTVVGIEGVTFTAPRVGAPELSSSVHLGEAAPWPVLTLMDEEHAEHASVFQAREYEGAVLVARIHRDAPPDLIVYAEGPAALDAKERLREALRSLEPLLERASLIEALQERQATLERRNGVIRDLIYAFSHDLRTPLMANAMNMSLALEGAFGELSDDFRRTLEHGLEANRQLLDLAEELLLVARHESGEVLTPAEAVDVAALVRSEVSRQRSRLPDGGVGFEVSTPAGLRALGRAGDLRRVVQNLLDNAARYAPPDSRVRVTLTRDSDADGREGALLAVEDDGAGVPAAQRGRLFQRFSSGRAGGGLGLGLYLARRIVEAHHGTIRYEALDPRGSRFSVWLPLAAEAVAV